MRAIHGVGWSVLTLTSLLATAQVPYLLSYNPGPARGTPWTAAAATGDEASSASVVLDSPRPVWARVCYTVGPSDSAVALYAERSAGQVTSTPLAWGGCADVFGHSIWLGNPHRQVVGGYYGVAPAAPAE
jgi:hypothetical protein